MTYEIYRYIFIGGAILALISLVISVWLFILYRIPTVIGDLNGTNARKGIENIRLSSEGGGKAYSHIHKNQTTDKISRSGKIVKNTSRSLKASETEVLPHSNLPNSGGATDVLDNTEIGQTVNLFAANSTYAASETTVLDARDTNNQIVVEYEITYIHTDEIIE